MTYNDLKYTDLLNENKVLRERILELREETGWLKGKLANLGVPVTIGKRVVLTVTKGGKAI